MIRYLTSVASLGLLVSAVGTTAAQTTVTFQQGVNGYSGTSDTNVLGGSTYSSHNFGASDALYVLSSGGANPTGMAMVNYAGIFGAGLGQVPSGQYIHNATLTLNVQSTTIETGSDRTLTASPLLVTIPNYGNNDSAPSDLDFSGDGSYEVSYTARGWSYATSWMFWGGASNTNNNSGSNHNIGPEADLDYSTTLQSTKDFAYDGGNVQVTIDVTDIVNAWYGGAVNNYGFAIRPDTLGFTGVYVSSSEHANAALRPLLSITFDSEPVPEPTSLCGMLGIAGLTLLFRRHRHDV